MKSPVIFSKAMTFICKKFISLRPVVVLLEPVAISQGLAVNVLTSGDVGNILQYMYEQRIIIFQKNVPCRQMFRQKVLSDYRFSNGGPWQRRIQKPVKHLNHLEHFAKKANVIQWVLNTPLHEINMKTEIILLVLKRSRSLSIISSEDRTYTIKRKISSSIFKSVQNGVAYFQGHEVSFSNND